MSHAGKRVALKFFGQSRSALPEALFAAAGWTRGSAPHPGRRRWSVRRRFSRRPRPDSGTVVPRRFVRDRRSLLVGSTPSTPPHRGLSGAPVPCHNPTNAERNKLRGRVAQVMRVSVG